MRTLNRPLGRMFTAACILATTVHAFADVTWDAVKKKINDGKSYSVEYKYEGPKGKYKFDYRAVVPGKIRSEVKESKLDPSRAGAITFFDADFNKDKVRIKVNGGLVTRKRDHEDVADSALVTPMFTLILQQVGPGAPKAVAEGDKTRFEFNTGAGKYSIWANSAADITKTERIDSKYKEKEVRDFSTIKWNNNPDVAF